ncbi:hypothetical protein DXG03_005874 [Asterophora parasitica]|uniref:Uncharacterized protein n=1 Tax=Asterophora parasitica TaxID=117018 RepID=A0A9P7K8I5_9AGAR|nr:hypothetical protein DXG03_005874 [Asterophora parasitica]
MSQRMTLSTVRTEDLNGAGVVRKRLIFNPGKVIELAKALTTNAEAEISDLHSRLKKIYASVNMDYAPAPRMVLDTILLAVTDIASLEQTSVAILPEMRLPQGWVTHPKMCTTTRASRSPFLPI